VIKFLLFVALGLSAFAAEKDFNGRWNLFVDKEPRGRVWWLEVTGAGSKSIAGRFVGAPGGQMDAIPAIAVDGKELKWSFEKGGKKLTYVAFLEKNALVGRQSIDGTPALTFRGERAPIIRDKDGEQWKLGKTEDLMRSLDGWVTTFPGRAMEWTISDGILKNKSKASDIKTKEKYWNFELLAEFRYEKGSNSGIGLRGRYEVQIQDTHGQPLSGHSLGAIYSRIVPTADAANPPGEWQQLKVRLVGRTVTVTLNDKVIVDHKEIEGATAMAFDGEEAMPGPIAVQGDHGIVEFRKLAVTPLVR
jgi:hypothetical protein